MVTDKSTVKVPFGILNIKGLMQVNEDFTVEQPVFAHSTYPITTTLDPSYSSDFGKLSFSKANEPLEGKTYQKIYRKNVRWDFGDGTEIEGYSATHFYSIPGKYTITCTFFDIHRQGIPNEYKLHVIVKQVIPTMLAFNKEESSIESIPCSKIEKIARIEALLSNNVIDDVDIIAKLETHNVPQSIIVKDTVQRAENLIAYFHIEKPFVGIVKTISIQCRTNRATYMNTELYYLGIWEQDTAGHLTKIGISLNEAKQEYGKLITWNFQGVKLSGKPIKIALTRSIEEEWQDLRAPRMGPQLVTVSSSDDYSQGSPLPNSVKYPGMLPIMSIIASSTEDIKGEDVPGWNDVKDLTFPHLRKYQTFLNKTTEYYYNSQQIYKEFFQPTEKYSPEYEELYGYFAIEENNIVFKSYRVQPYSNRAPMPGLQINDPNKSILETESFTTYPVLDVSTKKELPKEAKYAGKRAFVDIFYRSDFLAYKDTIFFAFDIDNVNIHNSIESSTNFLNVPPLGLHLRVTNNDFTNINFSLTLNGFLSSFEPIDKLVQLSLVKNYTFTALLVPYFLSEYNNYYIPKDFTFADYQVQITNRDQEQGIIEQLSQQLPFLETFDITSKGKQFNVTFSITSGSFNQEIIFNLPIKNLDRIIIPTEKYYNQNVTKLIDTYTPHELFQHASILKETLVQVFENKNILNYILTKGINFFDDNINFKTSYVNNLLSTLHMMGKDAFEYDQTLFDGVNELKDLCRILSMNHSELVGNLIDEAYDIKYTESYKGKHIGDEILVTDEIFVFPENELVGQSRHQKGKIIKVKRDGIESKLPAPTLLVIRDNYTNETKIVNFSDIEPDKVEDDLNVYQIKSYKPSWSWGLLLPDKEDINGKILQSYYSFYLLKQPEHIIRVGNFLQENTITPEVENKNAWDEVNGKTFDKIQKVMHNALFL